jgi:DNA-binding NarL/FixJ family response regulator
MASSSAAVRILVVEDYEPWRRFVSTMLQSQPKLQLIGEAVDGLDAVQKAEELQPDLVLLDIGLPKLNGMEAAWLICNLCPRSKILFVSQENSADVVRGALAKGAKGYVLKSSAATELLPAIEAVLAGGRYVSESLRDDQLAQGANSHAHRHEILFFADDTVLVDGLAHFIGSALKAGNPAIVLATESHRESLLHRLQDQGVDVDAAIQQGTYISLDAAEVPDSEQFVERARGMIEAARKLGKTRHPRLAFCGERAGRLWADGKADAAIQLEQFCEDLATKYDIDILCGYPSSSLAATQNRKQFSPIYEAHFAVYSASADYRPHSE